MTWTAFSGIPLSQLPDGGVATDGTLIYIIGHSYPGSRLISYDPGMDSYTDIGATTNDGSNDDPIQGLSWISSSNSVVAMGSNSALNDSFTDLYGPLSGGSWTSGTPDPFGRRLYGVAGGKNASDKIILAGGYTDNTFNFATSNVQLYDALTNNWTTLASMPGPLAEATGTWVGTNFYVFGGWNQTDGYSSKGYKYNSVSNAWTTLAVPYTGPAQSMPYALTLGDGTIYLAGGWGPGGPTSDAWIYDPVADSWNLNTPLPFASNVTGVAIGQTVYVWDVWGSFSPYKSPIVPAVGRASGTGTAYNPTPNRSRDDFRWLFYDSWTGITWRFLISANAGGSPSLKKSTVSTPTTAIDGKPLIFEGSDEPQTIEFGGVLLEKEHLDVFEEWYNKRHQISLTDDLGRDFVIYITEFNLTRERAVQHPFKHEYTAKATILDWP